MEHIIHRQIEHPRKRAGDKFARPFVSYFTGGVLELLELVLELWLSVVLVPVGVSVRTRVFEFLCCV